MSYSTHLQLKPVSPYDLKLNVRMFIGNDPRISEFEKNKFWQVIKVNDKPIQLLNGSNLLHLLEQHGHKARIDLKEAKQLLDKTR
jgi:hypothetical protein